MKSALDFWILAMLVGTSQGGIQALSRSFFGKIIPKKRSNEFYGFYNIFGKFSAIMGPALMGVITQITGKTQYGVASFNCTFPRWWYFICIRKREKLRKSLKPFKKVLIFKCYP